MRNCEKQLWVFLKRQTCPWFHLRIAHVKSQLDEKPPSHLDFDISSSTDWLGSSLDAD
jgi:hypothetical protein